VDFFRRMVGKDLLAHYVIHTEKQTSIHKGLVVLREVGKGGRVPVAAIDCRVNPKKQIIE
jgi:hypothetical protein